VGIHADEISYTTLRDLPDAPEKARRDAPMLSVVQL
jgi:hypothetical protein